jgi:uncharacterized protein
LFRDRVDFGTATPLVPPERLDPVVAYFKPRRVILFGSTARGEAGPDSDIDLLVVLDDDAPLDKLTAKPGWLDQRRPARRRAALLDSGEAVGNELGERRLRRRG